MTCSHPQDRQFVQWNMDINDNMKIVQTFCGNCGKIVGEKK